MSTKLGAKIAEGQLNSAQGGYTVPADQRQRAFLNVDQR